MKKLFLILLMLSTMLSFNIPAHADKIVAYVTITRPQGNIQSNVIPIDTMQLCRDAVKDIIAANAKPDVNVVVVCVVQGN